MNDEPADNSESEIKPTGQTVTAGAVDSSPVKPDRPDKKSDKKPDMPKVTQAKYFGVVVLLVLMLGVGFLGGLLGASSKDNSTTSSGSLQHQVVLSNSGNIINKIATNVGQSVVSINDTQGGGPACSLFGYAGCSGSAQNAAGTGIVLTSDGLIITNRHVVPKGTTNISVTLADGTTYNNVNLVGETSPSDSLDIAFIKIQDTKGHTLVPATLGDSSQTKVGDQVVAIGNALGQFQNTVTSGIISGHGRDLQASDSSGASSENLTDLFQTDAAINEGNSGGPLVNLNQQVVAINVATASTAQNLGFAIPINDVSGLIKSVEQTGKLQRPYLGIVYISITADIASQYSLNAKQGAYIPTSSQAGSQTIISGGPAEKAGLKEGDIITKVNGQAIDQDHSLTSLLVQHSVGDTVGLTINRGGQTLNINATLQAAPTN